MATEWTMETIKAEMVKVCPNFCPDQASAHGGVAANGGASIHAQIRTHASRLACMYFKVPDNTVAQGQPPDTVKKYNDLVKILTQQGYDQLLIQQWNSTNPSLNTTIFSKILQGITQPTAPGPISSIVGGGLWSHEFRIKELFDRMETLEKTNKTLTQKDNKLMERVEVLEKTNKTLTQKDNKLLERVETLEMKVIFLKNRNTILERNCVIDNSKYAFLIQRYWKKYILIKRIKEAAKIYKLTRNFSRFVKPVELMEDLIDCRSVVGDPPVEIETPNHVPVTVGRRHHGPPSVTSESSIKRSEQIVRDWNN